MSDPRPPRLLQILGQMMSAQQAAAQEEQLGVLQDYLERHTAVLEWLMGLRLCQRPGPTEEEACMLGLVVMEQFVEGLPDAPKLPQPR